MAPETNSPTKRPSLLGGFGVTSSPSKRASNAPSKGSSLDVSLGASLPPAVTVKSAPSSGPSGGGIVLGEDMMMGTLGGSRAMAAVVDLDDELARKLRDAVHKEAISLSDLGSPAAVTEFLKTLCATYGARPDKAVSDSKHYLLSRDGFVKAASDVLKHLAPGDAGPIYDKLAKESGTMGVNYKTILRFISLDDSDVRRLARTLRLKIQEKGASEKSYRKLFPKLASGRYLDRGKLHELLHENFRVSLNERDLQGLFKYMDVDGDGEVSQEDFLLFLKQTGEHFDERGAQRSTTIVDVAVSLNAEQEAALAQLGYQMSEGNLNANAFGTSRIYLWYRRMSAVPSGQPVSPLVNIALHREKACNALVAAGYVRISHNINSGLTSRTPLFIWAKRAMTEAEADRDAILDVAVTCGRPGVREDRIWVPPSKDYIRVDGNLNERFFGQGVFLWFRAQSRRPLEVQKASPIKLVEHLTTAEKRALVEMNTKHYLRNYPPLWTLRDQMCPRADFAALFNKYDRNCRAIMSPDRFNDLLREVGLCMERDQLLAVVHRIDRSSDSLVSLDEYLSFLALSDDDMDQMEETIRQSFKLSKSELSYSNSRKFRIIKKRFQEFNAENNGILSRSDIFALCRAAGSLLSEPEVLNMQKRLDKDGNGQVDIWDFLRFLDAPDETKSRREKRVHEACEKLRHMILDRQNERKKLQAAGHIDSETSWNNFKERRKAVGAMPFTGVLVAEDFNQAVARAGVILSTTEGHQLCMRINPAARNEVDQAAFHAFVCRTPRFVTEVVNLMELEFLKDLMDVYRYSGKKHREKLMTTVRLRSGGEQGGAHSSSGGGGATDLPDSGNALYEEALDEMVSEFGPDERGQLTAPKLRKAMFSAINAAESDVLIDEEVVALAQYVGADDVRTYAINVRKFLEGVVVFAESLANGGPSALRQPSDYSIMVDAEDEEALIDVCIDIQRFIKEKAKLLDGTHNYQKAFDLFDEDGSGSITLIELKHMLERFNVLPRLEERTVLKLMERFDTSGEGLVSASEFKEFCETVFVPMPWSPGRDGKDGAGGGGGGRDGKKDGDGADRKKVDLDSLVGKVTSDKVTDTLVVDILKAMMKEGNKPLGRVNFQDLQKAFLASDPDLAGVITRHEFFKSLEKAKLTIGMDTYNASRALEFFMEDEDLVDYEAIIHALSRLRHLATSKMHPKRSAAQHGNEPPKEVSFTGHAKLDAKLGTMRFDLQKVMDEKERGRAMGGAGRGGATTTTTAPRIDPYRVFWKLDDDHDGKLTLSEFKRGLDKLKLKNATLSEKEVRTLFRRLDVDKSHKVDYREFIEFLLAAEDSKLVQQLGKKDGGAGGGGGKKKDDPFYFDTSDEEEDEGDEGDDVEETTVPGSTGEAAEARREEIYKKVFGALVDYEPNDAKRKAFPALLKKFDRTNAGLVSDRRFRAFIYKCQIDLHLSPQEVRWFVRDLDPDMTGNTDYARFFERLQKFEVAREKEKEDKKAAEGGAGGGKKGDDKNKKTPSIDTVAPLLKRIFDGINLSAVKGRPYHSLFSLSDEMQTGLVTREAFEHTLTILGCPLTKDEVQTVLDVLAPRKDKLIDYEELYHLILRTPGVGLLVTQGPGGGFGGTSMAGDPLGGAFGGDMGRTGSMRRTSINPVRMQAGRTLRWGGNTAISPAQMMMSTSGPATMVMPGAAGTQFLRTGALANMNNNFMQTGGAFLDASNAGGAPLSRSIRDDWGIDVIDPLLDSIGVRVRNCIRERVQQWGPNFSLHRQFESNDPEKKGYLPKKDFQRVLQHLGAPLSAHELAQVVQKFDRYGDSMVDYEEFCRVIMVDPKEFDGIVRRVATRLTELRRKGTNVVTAFEMFDMDGQGFIAARDFREACKQLQLPSTEVQLQTLMEHFSSVGDPNLICYDDFLTYVTGARGGGGLGATTMSGAGATMRQQQQQQQAIMGFTGSSAFHNSTSFAMQQLDDSFAADLANRGGATASFESGPFPEITRRLDFATTKSDLSASRVGDDPWRRTASLSPQRVQQQQQSPNGTTNYGNSMLFSRPVLSSGGVGSPYQQQQQQVSPGRTMKGPVGGMTMSFAAEGGATARRRAIHWMCPVCFFAENEARSAVCTMCTSPNPNRGDMQIMQQCFNCSFQNGDYSVECEMCGEPLASRASRTVRHNGDSPRRRENGAGSPDQPGKPRWRTYRSGGGADSDDSDYESGATRRNRRR